MHRTMHGFQPPYISSRNPFSSRVSLILSNRSNKSVKHLSYCQIPLFKPYFCELFLRYNTIQHSKPKLKSIKWRHLRKLDLLIGYIGAYNHLIALLTPHARIMTLNQPLLSVCGGVGTSQIHREVDFASRIRWHWDTVPWRTRTWHYSYTVHKSFWSLQLITLCIYSNIVNVFHDLIIPPASTALIYAFMHHLHTEELTRAR